MTDLGQELERRVAQFLSEHDPRTTERFDFLRARFDAGLAWVWFPEGHGGLGYPRAYQAYVDTRFHAFGAPDNNPRANSIGLGMAAPTILSFGTAKQKDRYLRPLWTGEERWCQLFSEPNAGSDLAAVATRAVRHGDLWTVSGQKVWTSNAHHARFGILLARSDTSKSKHSGLTYFVCDMQASGVEIRPLRQLTGEAEFNEVFLNDVLIYDCDRIGAEGDGWKVATATLNSERVAIGGKASAREDGMIGVVANTWRNRRAVVPDEFHDRLMKLWVDAEIVRLANLRLRQRLALGQPGPEGSALKLLFSRLNQQLSGLEVEMAGEEGLRYSDWTMTRPQHVEMTGRDPGYRYLRAKGNSIEGGTSEILRNVIAERVLGLPGEPRVDKDVPWSALKR